MELTDRQREAANIAINDPELTWRWLVKNQPAHGLMQKVDKMLVDGATPEWIMNRGPFFEMPVEIQTVLLNALHWRQAKLQRPLGG